MSGYDLETQGTHTHNYSCHMSRKKKCVISGVTGGLIATVAAAGGAFLYFSNQGNNSPTPLTGSDIPGMNQLYFLGVEQNSSMAPGVLDLDWDTLQGDPEFAVAHYEL
eukprot:9168140-Ditylum_brightwellii.AAC.1